METSRKNKKGNVINAVKEIKNVLELIGRLDTKEEGIDKLKENKSIETSQTELQRQNRMKQQNRTPKNSRTTSKVQKHVTGIHEVKENEAKEIFELSMTKNTLC